MRILTERLILREFTSQDWPTVLAYQSDPRYLQYYHWTERTPRAVRDFVNNFVVQQRDRPRAKFQLAIALQSDERLIGNCGIRKATFDVSEAEIGYELAPQQWGQGYASEAARAMVRFGFEELDLHRIWAECIADNRRSVRVLEKAGLQLEGRLRDKVYFKGRWWDTLLFAILEHEWHE